jgi:hypothetical protein
MIAKPKHRDYFLGLFVSGLILLGGPSLKAQVPIHFEVAYQGNNLWNPGLNLGLDYKWRENTRSNLRGKSRPQEFSFGTDLGFYHDPQSHSALFVQAGIQYRRYISPVWHWSTGFSPLGLYRSLLPETFEVNPLGMIETVKLPGRWYYAPDFSLGLERQRRQKSSQTWFTRLHVMLLMPYNTAVMPLLFVEVGWRLGR